MARQRYAAVGWRRADRSIRDRKISLRQYVSARSAISGKDSVGSRAEDVVDVRHRDTGSIEPFEGCETQLLVPDRRTVLARIGTSEKSKWMRCAMKLCLLGDRQTF